MKRIIRITNKHRVKDPKPELPELLYIPNFRDLQKEVEGYMAYLRSDDYHEDRTEDYEYSVFEAAVEAFYGNRVWEDYVNKCVR